MQYPSKRLSRKSKRLSGFDYSKPGFYFVTLNIRLNIHLLGHVQNNIMILNEPGKMVHSVWESLPSRFPFVRLDDFQVMPNHFHGIIEIFKTGEECWGKSCICPVPDNCRNLIIQGDHKDRPNKDRPNKDRPNKDRPDRNRPWGTLPGTLGRVIQAFSSITTTQYIKGVKQLNWRRFHRQLWKRNYHDHIIRNKKALERIRKYIQNNPAKWQDQRSA